MLEFILSTAIIVGKVDIGTNQVQYDVLQSDGEVVTIVDTNYTPDKNS